MRRVDGCAGPATAVLCAALVALSAPAAGAVGGDVIIDFRQGGEPWLSIDDAVMGGRSSSGMRVEGGRAVFAGEVSLENNGGFASVRSRPGSYDLSAFDGLRLRVRGDGRTYKLRLRTTAAFDGVSYQSPITPLAGEWDEVEVPFTAFEPVFRGRRVPGAPPLDPSRIVTVGLLISDRQEGPFALEIEWIEGLAR